MKKVKTAEVKRIERLISQLRSGIKEIRSGQKEYGKGRYLIEMEVNITELKTLLTAMKIYHRRKTTVIPKDFMKMPDFLGKLIDDRSKLAFAHRRRHENIA